MVADVLPDFTGAQLLLGDASFEKVCLVKSLSDNIISFWIVQDDLRGL
jgi:hypothetical protein